MFRKNGTSLRHHNFATLRRRVMQSSPKCLERNCLCDKGKSDTEQIFL